jgi:predicted TIM-barrel fold metal-dependent hydrolase
MPEKALSADGHVDSHWIPKDLFYEEAPASLKDRVPRFLDTPDGKAWHMGGKQTHKPVHIVLGEGKNYDRMVGTGFYSDAGKGQFRPTTPELRIKDQEKDGIVGEVLYGILGMDNTLKADPEALAFVYATYRKWISEFSKKFPNRFAALAPLSGSSAEQAASEVRDAASLGLKGIELKTRVAAEPFWHPMWEPLWNAIDETGMVVNFHSDISLMPRRGSEEAKAANPTLQLALIGSLGKMANAEFLGTLIYSGVLERHPKMQLVMGETDLGWIPHYLDRMNYMVVEREYSTGLPMLPSEYWHRQCKATFQNERLGVEMIKYLGVDNVMWGNDYPHPDGTWPASQQVFVDTMFDINDEDKHKILYSNCAKLYGFKDE